MISLDEKIGSQVDIAISLSYVKGEMPGIVTQTLYWTLLPFVDDYYDSFYSAMRRDLDD